MDEKRPSPDPVQIPIRADDAIQAGTFANVARISHNPDSFQVDFLVVHSHPPFARLQARVILTPSHAKRLLRALEDNLNRFEAQFGEIRAQDAPSPDGLGGPGGPGSPGGPGGYIQ